jgi:hypothetical protein
MQTIGLISRVLVSCLHGEERGRSVAMIPVQYRDPETEEILERRHEEGAPAIGTRVRIGFDDYQVLFRWRCVPTSCIVYVRRVAREVAA